MVFLEIGCILYCMNDVLLVWGLFVFVRGRWYGNGFFMLLG